MGPNRPRCVVAQPGLSPGRTFLVDFPDGLAQVDVPTLFLPESAVGCSPQVGLSCRDQGHHRLGRHRADPHRPRPSSTMGSLMNYY